MEEDRRGEHPTTATVAVANPSHNNFGRRRLKINGGVSSISSLPDEILHQILSLIPTKFAIRTSVLSKRWKHVWSEIPCLSFNCLDFSGEPISKTLASYTAAKITSCHLYYSTNDSESDHNVDSFIDFAKSHNADKLSLELVTSNYAFEGVFFNNSSLKQLLVKTRYCLMYPIRTVSWTSLKSLSLTHVILSDATFSKILSGSPMLESLTVECTSSFLYLDLSKSLLLRRLDIILNSRAEGTMQIVAPHISSLRLRNLEPINDQTLSNCTLLDVSSLTEANIDFNDLCYTSDSFLILQAMVQTMLEKLQNVENLTLGVNFLHILSMDKLCDFPFPTFKVKTLTLEARILGSLVRGISRLLKYSPGLKKMTLHTINSNTKADVNVNRYLDKRNLNPNQCWRFKKVVSPPSWKYEEVADPKIVGTFVKLLLANTRTLETLVLRLGRYLDKSRFEELSQITHTLSRDNKVSIVLK